jgi:selenocysteine-specific elongation factor
VLALLVRTGAILRLPGDVVLLAEAEEAAVGRLRGLGAPFTLSEARQALDTTRRTAVPLMEHLDARGRTRRLDDTHRVVADR